MSVVAFPTLSVAALARLCAVHGLRVRRQGETVHLVPGPLLAHGNGFECECCEWAGAEPSWFTLAAAAHAAADLMPTCPRCGTFAVLFIFRESLACP